MEVFVLVIYILGVSFIKFKYMDKCMKELDKDLQEYYEAQ